MVKPHEHMTENEARRALYIDFEGPKDGAPVLIGILRKQVQQYAVEAMFAPAGPDYVKLRTAIAGLVARARMKDRRIVSWSEHDLDLVRALAETDPGLVEAFESLWVNGLRLAERWADLREHNRYDCMGMKAVCVRAASEIERQDRRLRAGKKKRAA